MKRRHRRNYRRNAVTNDDIVHFALAGITGVALGFIMAKNSGPAPVSGLRGLRGLGAYFHDPVNLPVSGLGSNYVRVR